MYKSEKLDEIENKVEELEKKLEVKNAELENLQRRFNEVEFESRVEEVMLSTQKKNHKELAGLKSEMTIQIADLQNQCKEKVKKEVDNVLPTAVEQGLRDLRFSRPLDRGRSRQLRPHHGGVQQLRPTGRRRWNDEHHLHQWLLHHHCQWHCPGSDRRNHSTSITG